MSGRDLVPVGQFGPLDALADVAYTLYVEGEGAAALEAVGGGLVLTEAAGDDETGRYLRYIGCLVREQQGDWAALRARTERCLAGLGDDAGPFWRAKFLGLRSHAMLQLGESVEALAALAEGYALLLDHPGLSYNRGSACHAVSGPMCTALLFEPAMEVMRTAVTLTERATVAPIVVLDLSFLHVVRGLLRELVGRDAEADADYAVAASLAVRALDRARALGDETTELSAAAGLQTAYQRLRCEPVDLALLERHAEATWPTRDSMLSSLALASAHARAGRFGPARRICAEVAERAEQLGELVFEWVGTAWIAQLDEHELGTTGATAQWRRVAEAHLEQLVLDRAGRFDGLIEWRRVSELRRREDEATTRLGEDPLTLVGNRRLLQDALAAPDSTRRPVAFLDVDRFKAVNDDHGHDVGDGVLVAVAGVLRSLTRSADVVVRYGGDEFVVLLAEGSDPRLFARRVHDGVAAVDWCAIGVHEGVGVTVGVCDGGPGAVERADAHLRRLKAARTDDVLAPRRARSLAVGGSGGE